MRTVVISQPMFFPWPGMLEQLRLADVFVHYDDVQFSKGSFTNRVQVKTPRGVTWLTVPLSGMRLGQRIDAVAVGLGDWRAAHLALLERAYGSAPHRREMLDLVHEVYAAPVTGLADLSILSFESLARYFDLLAGKEIVRSSSLGVGGASGQRVLSLVKSFGGDTYVTGHGAQRYLDHEAFESAGVLVRYIDYRKTPFAQLHGPFTPFVSALDLVANEGKAGRRVIASDSVGWREFLARPHAVPGLAEGAA
jgi:hypothetical protein